VGPFEAFPEKNSRGGGKKAQKGDTQRAPPPPPPHGGRFSGPPKIFPPPNHHPPTTPRVPPPPPRGENGSAQKEGGAPQWGRLVKKKMGPPPRKPFRALGAVGFPPPPKKKGRGGAGTFSFVGECDPILGFGDGEQPPPTPPKMCFFRLPDGLATTLGTKGPNVSPAPPRAPRFFFHPNPQKKKIFREETRVPVPVSFFFSPPFFHFFFNPPNAGVLGL